jgi:hypothetical protein
MRTVARNLRFCDFLVDPNGGFWYLGVVVLPPIKEKANDLSLYFWRIYEMDFPEGSNVKAPRGLGNYHWSLSFLSFKIFHPL